MLGKQVLSLVIPETHAGGESRGRNPVDLLITSTAAYLLWALLASSDVLL